MFLLFRKYEVFRVKGISCQQLTLIIFFKKEYIYVYIYTHTYIFRKRENERQIKF